MGDRALALARLRFQYFLPCVTATCSAFAPASYDVMKFIRFGRGDIIGCNSKAARKCERLEEEEKFRLSMRYSFLISFSTVFILLFYEREIAIVINKLHIAAVAVAVGAC